MLLGQPQGALFLIYFYLCVYLSKKMRGIRKLKSMAVRKEKDREKIENLKISLMPSRTIDNLENKLF